jgi:phosphate transport system substrate-binding protein
MRSRYLVFLIVFFLGCNSEEKETTTKGNLQVFIPESIAPVIRDEVKEFLALYQAHGAHITDTIVTAETVARQFLLDSVHIAFLPRPLTPVEKDTAKKITGTLSELIVAYDGIVVVVHPMNKISEMTTTDVQQIISGSLKRWEQLAKTMKGTINIYCHDSSDVTEFLQQRLRVHGGISTKFVRTQSDIQTLQLVEKDPLALGFVALVWMGSDTSAAKIINLGRTREDTDTTFTPPSESMGKFFSSHLANIYRNYYPLKRAIYMYTKGQVNLAAGFGTYVATPEGQKIFLNYGLLPGTQKIKLKSNQPD